MPKANEEYAAKILEMLRGWARFSNSYMICSSNNWWKRDIQEIKNQTSEAKYAKALKTQNLELSKHKAFLI
jgi:hypothetical protein